MNATLEKNIILLLKALIYLSTAALLFYFFWVRVLSAVNNYPGIEDFNIFANSAHFFIENGLIYQFVDDLTKYAPGSAIYKFPPLYGSILIELFKAGVSDGSVKTFCAWLHVFCFYGSAVLCVMSVKRPANNIVYAIVAAIIMASSPLLEWNIFFLQLDVYILFLLSLSMFLMARNKQVLTGIMIGLAAALKIYPVVMAFYFILTFRWKVLAGIILSIVIATVFSIYSMGLNQNIIFFKTILPYLLKELPSPNNPYNVSFSKFIMEYGATPQAAAFISLAILIGGVIFFSITHLKISRQANKGQARIHSDILSFAGCLALTVIFMKNSWWNYQVLFVIPIVVIALSIMLRNRLDWISIVLLMGALVLLNISTLTQLIRNDWGVFSLYARGLGPIIMLVILLKARWSFDINNPSNPLSLSLGSSIAIAALIAVVMLAATTLAYRMGSLHEAWLPFHR